MEDEREGLKEFNRLGQTKNINALDLPSCCFTLRGWFSWEPGDLGRLMCCCQKQTIYKIVLPQVTSTLKKEDKPSLMTGLDGSDIYGPESGGL